MSVLNIERPDFMAEEDIRMFEASVAKFFEQNAPPEKVAKWRKQKCVDRDMWTKAGEAGLTDAIADLYAAIYHLPSSAVRVTMPR